MVPQIAPKIPRNYSQMPVSKTVMGRVRGGYLLFTFEDRVLLIFFRGCPCSHTKSARKFHPARDKSTKPELKGGIIFHPPRLNGVARRRGDSSVEECRWEGCSTVTANIGSIRGFVKPSRPSMALSKSAAEVRSVAGNPDF